MALFTFIRHGFPYGLQDMLPTGPVHFLQIFGGGRFVSEETIASPNHSSRLLSDGSILERLKGETTWGSGLFGQYRESL